ncbi:MAG: DMT family transporter [Thermoflexaceae bacterium]|nr:DMT family transporter [Thermoflexaceae bacterium]
MDEKMMEKSVNAVSVKAVSEVLLAGFCWGLIGLFTRPLSQAGMSPMQITAVRCIVAGAALFFYLLIKDKKVLKIHLKDIWMFIGTGIISIVFFNVCYFTTINMATLSFAAILLYTSPYFVMILSAILFREKITRKKITALLFAFAGCVLVTGFQTDGIKAFSILTGLGSGLCYGLYSIFGNIALKKYSSMTVTVYTFLVAAVGISPFAGMNEITGIIAGNQSVLWIIVALGIFSTMLPFVLYTEGLSHMEAGKAAVLAFSEPLAATLAGIVVFHEKITFMSAVGIGMMFLAIIYINRKNK